MPPAFPVDGSGTVSVNSGASVVLNTAVLQTTGSDSSITKTGGGALTLSPFSSVGTNDTGGTMVMAYYQMLWLSGVSQGDIARLRSENIQAEVLARRRGKLPEDTPPSCLRVGPAMQQWLETLPGSGYLFPKIARQKPKDRAAEFCHRCGLLGIQGLSLHSYRYAWAGRAAQAGYNLQRYAQAAPGHGQRGGPRGLFPPRGRDDPFARRI